MKAALSPLARRELLAAARWIAGDSPTAARRLIAAVDEARVLIAEQPEIGRLREDLTPLPMRFLLLRGVPYVIAYRPDAKPARIVRVIHTSRDLPAALRSP